MTEAAIDIQSTVKSTEQTATQTAESAVVPVKTTAVSVKSTGNTGKSTVAAMQNAGVPKRKVGRPKKYIDPTIDRTREKSGIRRLRCLNGGDSQDNSPPPTPPLKNTSVSGGGSDDPPTIILSKLQPKTIASGSQPEKISSKVSGTNGTGKKISGSGNKNTSPPTRAGGGEQRTVRITELFQKLKAARDYQVVLNRGGAGSSKSHSVYQLMVERLFSTNPRKVLILRKTLPSLKASVKPKIDEILDDYNLRKFVKEEKQEMNYRYGRNLIHFGSLFTEPERIKSTEWNDILLEEATEFSYNDYKQLKLRLRARDYGMRNQMHLAFNPINEFHWIKTELIDKSERDMIEIVSTYKDNPFLELDYIEMIKALEKQDKNFYRIYTLGEWGSLENIIYSNWDVVKELPEGSHLKVIYGLDFGFSSPSCLVKCHVDEKAMEAWLETEMYNDKYTNDDLIKKVLDRKLPQENKRRHVIYADTQEPARIEEINRAGYKCVASDKSVGDGIDFCKRWKLHIVENEFSQEAQKELSGYSYREDTNGHVMEEPVKFNDHFCDGFRYPLYTHFGKPGGKPEIRVM